MRARGKISVGGGHQAHLCALAYFSDSNFLSTTPRVHGVPPSAPDTVMEVRQGTKLRQITGLSEKKERSENGSDKNLKKKVPEVGMVVSLDHSIYFHNPKAFRADNWMFLEMESPWAGEGRGLVMAKIWSQDGVLIATCIQEASLFLFSVYPRDTTRRFALLPS
jgi:acyl-CoA thioesterase 8